jgi:hypothetical protein
MKAVRRLSRRSFLGRVVGGAAVGGSALLVLGGQAEAFQVTDSDSGPNSDPPGRGRGSRSGLSDSDPVDPGGNGRGPRHATCTDSDAGPNSDGAGRGRGNNVTDGDSGSNADAARCGRGPHR